MANDHPSSQPSDAFKLPPWLVIAVILLGTGFAWWKNNHDPNVKLSGPKDGVHSASRTVTEKPLANLPDEHEPAHPELAPEPERVSRPVEHSRPHLEHAASAARKSDDSAFIIENQSIRDLNGKVVYKGTVDLKPTLDRIGRGGSINHRNDGTSFQNREGRLPRKPAGYYKEYVNPTPGEHGPGPQRIIIGQDGDIWYTPDHYKTFKQIK